MKQFSDNLKRAEITLVFKKQDRNIVRNCKHLSVLPVIEKIFERKLQKELHTRGINFNDR